MLRRDNFLHEHSTSGPRIERLTSYIGFFSDRSSTFKKYIEEKQKSIEHLYSPLTPSDELEKKLQQSEAFLKVKEEHLHNVRRSARDTMLDSILGELGLPGGIRSSVMRIAIDYDKVKFGSRETDGSLHQLTDQRAATTALEKEIKALQESIELLKSEIALAKKKEQEQRWQRMKGIM